MSGLELSSSKKVRALPDLPPSPTVSHLLRSPPTFSHLHAISHRISSAYMQELVEARSDLEAQLKTTRAEAAQHASQAERTAAQVGARPRRASHVIDLPRPSTPFHDLPRPSTPFHDLPRPSTAFHALCHALPRPSHMRVTRRVLRRSLQRPRRRCRRAARSCRRRSANGVAHSFHLFSHTSSHLIAPPRAFSHVRLPSHASSHLHPPPRASSQVSKRSGAVSELTKLQTQLQSTSTQKEHAEWQVAQARSAMEDETAQMGALRTKVRRAPPPLSRQLSLTPTLSDANSPHALSLQTSLTPNRSLTFHPLCRWEPSSVSWRPR